MNQPQHTNWRDNLRCFIHCTQATVPIIVRSTNTRFSTINRVDRTPLSPKSDVFPPLRHGRLFVKSLQPCRLKVFLKSFQPVHVPPLRAGAAWEPRPAAKQKARVARPARPAPGASTWRAGPLAAPACGGGGPASAGGAVHALAVELDESGLRHGP